MSNSNKLIILKKVKDQNLKREEEEMEEKEKEEKVPHTQSGACTTYDHRTL